VVDTLWVGTDPPTNPTTELWYDTDEPVPAPIPGDVQLVGAAGKPAFLNNWVNQGGGATPLHYYLASAKEVVIVGRIKLGTLPSLAFTLPAGYRPLTSPSVIATCQGNLVGYCVVQSDGGVLVGGANNADTGLNLIFRIDV
jgi:hypothetical protein